MKCCNQNCNQGRSCPNQDIQSTEEPNNFVTFVEGFIVAVLLGIAYAIWS